MRGPRIRTAVVASGLSALLAVGLAAPASATSTGTPVAGVAVVSATTPFPGKTPAAVLKLSVATARKATGVHVKGTAVVDGSTSSVDMVITKTAAKGQLASTAEGTAYFLRIGSTVYLGGDAKFWTTSADAATAKTLVGKWVKVTGTDASSKELRAMTTIAYWINEAANLKVTKFVAGTVIRRLPTVGVADPSATGGTVYVATKGKPYPLSVKSTDGKSTQS